MTADHDIIH